MRRWRRTNELPNSADTSEANVLRLAAKALDVPEEHIEVKRTGGGWLARERQEEAK